MGIDGKIVGEALLLGALADNGEPTRTLLPSAGSPLIGAVVPIAGVTTDQRGVSRTVPMTIGAVQIFVPVPPPPAPTPAGPPRDVSGEPGDRSAVVIDGATTGMVGERVTPWMRLPGPHSYEPVGSGSRVSADGTFTWQWVTAKKMYVYFRAGDEVRSNRVIIPAR